VAKQKGTGQANLPGNTVSSGGSLCSGKGLRVAGTKFRERPAWSCRGISSSVGLSGFARCDTTAMADPKSLLGRSLVPSQRASCELA
jgi:hypothetical protein